MFYKFFSQVLQGFFTSFTRFFHVVYRETILKCCLTGRVVLLHVRQGFLSRVRQGFLSRVGQGFFTRVLQVFSRGLQGDNTEMLCDR